MKFLNATTLILVLEATCMPLQGCGATAMDSTDAADDDMKAPAEQSVSEEADALAQSDIVVTWQDSWMNGTAYNRIVGGDFKVSEDRDLWIGFRCVSPAGANTFAAVALLGGPTYKNTGAYHCDGKWYREKVYVRAGQYYLYWLSDGGGKYVSLAAWRRR
jgi:hypothetical protein